MSLIDEYKNGKRYGTDWKAPSFQHMNDLVGTVVEANTDATEAKTTALAAEARALEAIEAVAEGEGTKVSVGGQLQSSLSFISDPQTQIDSLKTDIQVGINNIATDLTGKADIDAENLAPENVVSWKNKLTIEVANIRISTPVTSVEINNLDGVEGDVFHLYVFGECSTEGAICCRFNNISSSTYKYMIICANTWSSITKVTTTTANNTNGQYISPNKPCSTTMNIQISPYGITWDGQGSAAESATYAYSGSLADVTTLDSITVLGGGASFKEGCRIVVTKEVPATLTEV